MPEHTTPSAAALPRRDERVRAAVAREMAVDETVLTEGTHLADDLGVDSLQAVALMAAVEDELGAGLPDDLLDGVVTYGHFASAVRRALE